ncbi:MAG: hypothetical protein KF774_09635 [Planctomyces sp.]|nr:hypothetical protein [Planctomyces sp.]
MSRFLAALTLMACGSMGLMGCTDSSTVETEKTISTPGGTTTVETEKTIEQSGDNPPPALP